MENQFNGPENASKLLDELSRLINKYQPDCLGLNEVLQHVDAPSPFVLDYLKTLGYKYSYFAPSSPIKPDWLIGSAVCSRLPLQDTEDIILGEDVPASRRGIAGQTHKSIATKVQVGSGASVGLIVAHLVHLRSYTLRAHYQEQHVLAQFIRRNTYGERTIVGGDFNEPRWFPRSFRSLVGSLLYHKTGTLRKHTWHHNASEKTIVRANLDRLFWTKKSKLKLKEFLVVPTDISDHKPIFTTFEV
jgi:endonuclease/exonuclease/phosphatase (EEP) superfamily protein YafD